MTTKTKMIIITSDEDLIQQLSTQQNTNTQIIDLGDTQQTNPVVMPTPELLTELSEINSRIDKVYKRALQTPSDYPSKKPTDSNCAVCHDRAIGFNYDVLTCGSCKIFFHRNANRNLGKLKCLTGKSQCPVRFDVRRKCPRCRLARSFAVGMKKEFLISEEELRSRRKRLQDHRNISADSEVLSKTLNEIDQLMTNVDKKTESTSLKETLFETLSVEDWLAIENVRSAFVSVFQKFHMSYSSLDSVDPLSNLISWSHCFNEVALRFIQFYRQIEEFEHLHADDRFTLIKYNLLSIYPISKCFNFDSDSTYSLYSENEIGEQQIETLTSWGASMDISEVFVNVLELLLRLSENDSTFLILLMTILIFTQGLSMNEEEPPLNDPLAVGRAQMRYTTLLWNYLINKRGEVKATKQFIQLMNKIFIIQSKTKTFQDLFRIQMRSSNTVDQIAPLLQTVLHIS